LLRDLARSEDIAVVVANQVADRFTGSDTRRAKYEDQQQTQSSPLAFRGEVGTSSHLPSSTTAPQPSHPNTKFDRTEALTLDHQQRWFTGWGDDPSITAPKTPSLGLVWTTQIACRIALLKVPVYEDVGGEMNADGERSEREMVLKEWKRYMKVVFAPWTGPTGVGIEGAVEFKITGVGIKSVVDDGVPTKVVKGG
jgi:DNA repair protein RAD57